VNFCLSVAFFFVQLFLLREIESLIPRGAVILRALPRTIPQAPCMKQSSTTQIIGPSLVIPKAAKKVTSTMTDWIRIITSWIIMCDQRTVRNDTPETSIHCVRTSKNRFRTKDYNKQLRLRKNLLAQVHSNTPCTVEQ